MKKQLCFFLLFSLLLCCPISAATAKATEAPALTLTQQAACEPGQAATLILSLPEMLFAGGFFSLQYDSSLFSLCEISLLQATEALTLTYDNAQGRINVLLDAADNVQVTGALLSLTFACSEEAQPGTYPIICTVPSADSFYALNADGSTYVLPIDGCQGQLTLSAPILPACPARYLACQETNPVGGSITVRVCAAVPFDASLSRGSYGFVCAVTDASGTRELTLDGSEILHEVEGGGRTYTAAELGCNVYTATLTVPATGTVRITLTPYVSLAGQTLYAGSYTLCYSDGVYVGTTNQ